MQDKLTQAAKTPLQSSAKTHFKSSLKIVVKVAFAMGLIYWMVREGALDFETFAKLATPGLLLFAGLCVFIQIFINNFRWLYLLRGQGFESTVRQTMPLSLIGIFFNFAMPGGVGGDVVKGYYLLQDHPKQKFAAAMSIFMDRMMGFFVMVGTAFLALFFNWSVVMKSPELRSISVGVSLLFLAFLSFYFLSLSKLLKKTVLGRFVFETLPGGGKLYKIYEALHAYRKSPGALLIAVALSLLNQIVIVFLVYAIARAMGITDLPLVSYFFIIPIGMVILALPIAPAGIGVGQAAFFFLFNLYMGRETALGPTAITMMQILQLFWGLFGAYFYLVRKSKGHVPVVTNGV